MRTNPVEVVVVGGGSGGTLSANLLAKRLANEIRRGQVRVNLISSSKQHVFQPGYLHVAFTGQDPAELVRSESSLVKPEIRLVEQHAERIDLKTQTITVGSGERLRYDYLVIATGSVANPKAIPGLDEAALNFHTSPEESRKIWDALAQFDGGHVIVGIAGVPHKCPPSPNEAAFLADDYFRKRGIRDKVKLTFLTPYPRAYPAEPMSKVVEPRFQKRGIELVTFFNVESVDPAKREIYSLEGETVTYDLLLMVPPHRGSDVIINSGIGDADGWIPTDKHTMRIVGYENAYAVGDATNLPVSKTGVTAHLEAGVATSNIVSSIRSGRELYRYNGRIHCPFEMGSSTAAFVIGSYDMPVKQIQPTRIRYLMKKAFAKFYWQTVSGDWDSIFSIYFGKTHTIQRT
jgi:sulfide:quinone oxidoreductase